jgi:hypothetical protein
MPIVSITRLKLRGPRFLPAFLWLTVRSQRQVARADGCLGHGVQGEAGLVVWTRSAWRDPEALRAFMMSGPHAKAMPKLQHWCSEASVARWESGSAELPDWAEARLRLQAEGRLSRVRHPSPAQAAGEMAT